MDSQQKKCELGPWNVSTTQGPILKSSCPLQENSTHEGDKCAECCFAKLNYPLPEMVFGENCLRIAHQAGFALEFRALDALKLVDDKKEWMHVPVADQWQKERQGVTGVDKCSNPYDWTYSTPYRGSLVGDVTVSTTEERINLDKLREREKILFFDEILLFEDELGDNGGAQLEVKVRCMPSGFFVLQRFFLRVDGSIVRLHDTRLYHGAGTDYAIREYLVKEKKISELPGLEAHELRDPDFLSGKMKEVELVCERLQFPSAS
ncbi:TIP41-like protein [Sycon ciliatum]|uniref:TIP41-like protein n=1 Tax=Sycon ciliatum TaxID=27933 RepID=UPI0031F6F7B4|eukprot:scpid45717/ scgid31727/ TIP41-like protein